MLADRSDMQEELTRLSVHAAELRRMLHAGGEVGKRLDFLLQELNRETNTILSKSSTIADSGLTITTVGIALKANIERMREQALKPGIAARTRRLPQRSDPLSYDHGFHHFGPFRFRQVNTGFPVDGER